MVKRIVYDKSIYGATKAGVFIFAQGLLNELRKSDDFQVIEFNNRFRTFGKSGISRKIASLLRLVYMESILFRYKFRSIFIFPGPEMPILVALFRLKYVITIHDLFTWKNTNKTTWFARIRQKLLPFYAHRAKFVLTVSEYSKSEIVKHLGIKPNKVIVCHNAIENQSFSPCSSPTKPLSKLDKFILFVGSSEPRKNLRFLIDVYDSVNQVRLRQSKPLIKLVMTCAESWCDYDVKSRVEKSPFRESIISTGYISDADKVYLYQNAIATVIPSLAEGFGIPVVESLANGTPVLIQNNTALSMFQDFGATVMDEFDREQWAKILNEIVDTGSRVSEPQIKKVREHFRWASTTLGVFERIRQS